MRKLYLAIVVLGVALMLSSLLPEYMMRLDEIVSTKTYANRGLLPPLGERVFSITVSELKSSLNVTLSANSTVSVELERHDKVEKRWEGTEILAIRAIPETGVWSISILNNDASSYSDYQYMITLSEHAQVTVKPYEELSLGLVLAGLLSAAIGLAAMLVAGASKRTVAEAALLVAALFMLVGLQQVMEVVLRTDTPWATVGSSSMEPSLRAGDLVLLSGFRPGELIPGDIILFDKVCLKPGESTFTATWPTLHRIVANYTVDGRGYFETKGDNNADKDDWSVPEKGIVGKAVLVLPGVGMAVLLLQKIEVKFFILSLIVFLLFSLPTLRSERARRKAEREAEEKLEPTVEADPEPTHE